jgi:hypothetical protein
MVNQENNAVAQEGERKEANAGLFEVLRELTHRIRSEILLFGFVFALIIAFVAITTREFPVSLGITFISLYLIAVGCYFIQKGAKTRSELNEEASRSAFHWEVFCPPAFQSPTTVDSRLSLVSFNFKIIAKNLSESAYLTKVYVKSESQAIAFAQDSPVRMWKRHHWIVPYREEAEITLDGLIEMKMSPSEQESFVFHGLYRPFHADRDFRLRKTLLIMYQLCATSEDKRWIIDSGLKRIEIPFKDKVEYASSKE